MDELYNNQDDLHQLRKKLTMYQQLLTSYVPSSVTPLDTNQPQDNIDNRNEMTKNQVTNFEDKASSMLASQLNQLEEKMSEILTRLTKLEEVQKQQENMDRKVETNTNKKTPTHHTSQFKHREHTQKTTNIPGAPQSTFKKLRNATGQSRASYDIPVPYSQQKTTSNGEGKRKHIPQHTLIGGHSPRHSKPDQPIRSSQSPSIQHRSRTQRNSQAPSKTHVSKEDKDLGTMSKMNYTGEAEKNKTSQHEQLQVNLTEKITSPQVNKAITSTKDAENVMATAETSPVSAAISEHKSNGATSLSTTSQKGLPSASENTETKTNEEEVPKSFTSMIFSFFQKKEKV